MCIKDIQRAGPTSRRATATGGDLRVANLPAPGACYALAVNDPGSAWRERVRTELRESQRRVRLVGVIAIQAGVAAGLAWFVAFNLLHHVRPFFAPISAVIVLSAAAGKRWRRAMEMVVGVALDIAVGDALIAVIGVGAAQIAAVVALAILVSTVLGTSHVTTRQAAASAVLVATLATPSTGIYASRFADALVGGIVGPVVMAVMPVNPLTRVQRDAGAALTVLSEALTAAAQALERRDPRLARRALDALRRSEDEYAKFVDSLTIGQEAAAVSPLRWSARSDLVRYVDAAVHIERVTRNLRVTQHWIVAVIRDREPIPAGLPRSLHRLSKAVATLRRELDENTEPLRTRDIVCDAVQVASSAYTEGVGFASGTMIAQVRGTAVDLLVAAGRIPNDAEADVREAAIPRGRDRG
jgi:uncharacterized membrane protein YgaE (UPF0421/DUF939 family)